MFSVSGEASPLRCHRTLLPLHFQQLERFGGAAALEEMAELRVDLRREGLFEALDLFGDFAETGGAARCVARLVASVFQRCGLGVRWRTIYTGCVTQAVANILAEVERLSPPERADLADRLVETLAEGTSPEIERAQLEEVRRRIAQIESGEVTLIPGEQALDQIRRLVANVRATS